MTTESGHNLHPHPKGRTLSLLTGVVLLVGLTALAPKLLTLSGSTLGSDPASASALVAPSDPTAIAAGLDRAAVEAGFGNKVSSQAQDTQNNAIAGSDRGFANRWVTEGSSPSGQRLSLVVISESFMSLASAQKDCQARLAVGHAVTCVASGVGDLVVQDIERGAERWSDGWPVVDADKWDTFGNDLWVLHQAIVRSPNGTTVYAHEATQARNLDEARASWLLTQASLRDSATKLAFPLWEDTTKCGWITAALRDNRAC